MRIVEVGIGPRQRRDVPCRLYRLGKVWKSEDAWYACTATAYNAKRSKQAVRKCLFDLYSSELDTLEFRYGAFGMSKEALEKLFNGRTVKWI